MLDKVKLPQDSLDYIRWQLNIGAYLSEKAEKILDLFSGDIYTYLPVGLDPQTLTDYSESIHYLTGISMLKESRSLVCDLIKNYLGKGSKNLAVFETIWEEHEFNTINCPFQHFFY